MNANAPMVMIGAVSPMARERPRNQAGENSTGRVRQHMVLGDLPARRAEPRGSGAGVALGILAVSSLVFRRRRRL